MQLAEREFNTLSGSLSCICGLYPNLAISPLYNLYKNTDQRPGINAFVILNSRKPLGPLRA